LFPSTNLALMDRAQLSCPAYNREVVALAAALAVETVAFFAILARLVQVQVPALSFSALAHTQRPEGGHFSNARPACVLYVLCTDVMRAEAVVHGPLSAGRTGSDTVPPGQRELRGQTQALERESLGRTSAVKEKEGLWEVHEQLLSTSAALQARLKEVTAGPHSGTTRLVSLDSTLNTLLFQKNTSVWRCSIAITYIGATS
jgi:hypothetical protein